MHTDPHSTGGGSFTDLFIRRPVLAVVVALLLLIAGGQAIFTLTVRQYPRSDNASVTISTIYIGANADLVRGFITTPIERAIAAADGIDYVESESSQGRSLITARLKLNYDPTKALSEISAKVDQVRGDLLSSGLFAILKKDFSQLGGLHLIDHFGGCPRNSRSHSHIEGTFLLERKSAFSGIQMTGGNSQIQHRSIK